MGDSDSDDDLFAAKDVSTRCGRVVKPTEPFRARPAPSQASATARVLDTCDFLKQMIKEENTRAQIFKAKGLDPKMLEVTLPVDQISVRNNDQNAKKGHLDHHTSLERARELVHDDDSEDDEITEREVTTGRELFHPVPDICPAPLQMGEITRAIFQNTDFPGSAVVIENIMARSPSESNEEVQGFMVGVDSSMESSRFDVNADEIMLEQWLNAVLDATNAYASVQLEELSALFFRLAAFHPKSSIAHKAVNLAARSLRPGKPAPWGQGDFLDALVVYGFDTSCLPPQLGDKCADASSCRGARYAIGSLVQVKYDEGWYDGYITKFAEDGYTVTMIGDNDEQNFSSFPDPDVRPATSTECADFDCDGFQGRKALCRHLLSWLWLLQLVLRHPGGLDLTFEETVGPGSWLDLMCALRVEPNVVHAPHAAYEAMAPMVGMGTSTVTAIEECARLLLLAASSANGSVVESVLAPSTDEKNEIATAVSQCFCGQGMVKESAPRMLLYQALLPCTSQGEMLRRAVMSRELQAVFGTSRCCLFEADSSMSEEPKALVLSPSGSMHSSVDEAAARVRDRNVAECLDGKRLQREWTAHDALQAARKVSVERGGKQVTVDGRVICDTDFSRILMFLRDCIEETLPECKGWLYSFSHKSAGNGSCSSRLAVLTGLQNLCQSLDQIFSTVPPQLRECEPRAGAGVQSTLFASFSKISAPPATTRTPSASLASTGGDAGVDRSLPRNTKAMDKCVIEGGKAKDKGGGPSEVEDQREDTNQSPKKQKTWHAEESAGGVRTHLQALDNRASLCY